MVEESSVIPVPAAQTSAPAETLVSLGYNSALKVLTAEVDVALAWNSFWRIGS